ncbi:MAG: hypothetical protein IK098_06540 [Bacteroidales bacterium]|nr:hypothetical protein [Bacteroidales bacterium]
MKTKLMLVCGLMALCGSAFAQSRDIGLQVGVNVPVSQTVGIGSDMMLGVSYGQFYYNGFGFRAGFQYAASTADINDVIGVPVAFAYRTRAKSTGERFETGAVGARDAMIYRYPRGHGDVADLLGGFLLNLFSDVEFFAGLTPGYILGASEKPFNTTWVEKKYGFSLSVDAGVGFNYSIWRFDLKLTPAFHYNLTDNYIHHLVAGTTSVDRSTPIRWFFTLNGGLAFRF